MATATPNPRADAQDSCVSYLGCGSFSCCPIWHEHINMHFGPCATPLWPWIYTPSFASTHKDPQG